MGTRWIRGACLIALHLTAGIRAHADTLDQQIQAELKKQGVPSMTLAVVRHGRIVKSSAYGFANLEWREPATPDTRYEIASMSKMFTGEAIRILADERQLSLEDPLTKYFDGLPDSWSGMKIRHLLNMSSGLPEDWGAEFMPYSADVMTDYNDDTMVKAFTGLKMPSPVGQEFHYSSPNYAMLGIIVSKITHRPLASYVQERMFAPAGMTHATYIDPFAIVPKRAEGYRMEKGQLRKGFRLSPYLHARADVGILTTAEDMARWVLALKDGKIVRQPERLWEPSVSDAGHALDYNYGWTERLFHGHRLTWHSGGFRTGFRSVVMMFPDDDLSIAMLTNCDFFNGSIMMPLVASHYLKDIAWGGTPDRETDAEETHRLVAAVTSVGNGHIDENVMTPNALEPFAIGDISGLVAQLKGWSLAYRRQLPRPISIHGHRAVRMVALNANLQGDAMQPIFYLDQAGKVVYVEP